MCKVVWISNHDQNHSSISTNTTATGSDNVFGDLYHRMQSPVAAMSRGGRPYMPTDYDYGLEWQSKLVTKRLRETLDHM